MMRRYATGFRPKDGRTPLPRSVYTRVDADIARRKSVETGRIRLMVAAALFIAAFAVIAGRLVDVTVLNGGKAIAAAREDASPAPLRMGRADIVDRHGAILATSLPTVNLYADARAVIDAEDAAAELVRVLPDLTYADTLEKLSSDRAFVYLDRHLTPEQQDAVNRLGIPGVHFEEAERRVYPFGPLAAHVVGLTDIDNNGTAGIEKTFDAELKTTAQPLRLSIDTRVQNVLREELSETMAEFSAIGAAGLVMDARTGELVAMTSLPDFDPNHPETADGERMFNRASLGVYEMGSTFKLFTAAMALDSGHADMSSRFDASKPLRVARHTISDFHPQNRELSVPEIMVHSSNIGSARMALAVGSEGQRAFLERLGLLSAAKLELPEVGRPLVPSPWREINTMTISFGHGLAVTPVNLAAASAALVNGGVLRPATLMARHDTPEGRRVLKAETSRNIRALMRLVVERGTASKAEVAGYLVGGKTGTAEKLDPGGGYASDALLSSFISAFPISDPRYVVLTILDEPKGTERTFGYATAGWTAAPVAGRVIRRVAPLLGLPPADPFALEQRRAELMPAMARTSILGGTARLVAADEVVTGGVGAAR